MITVCRLRVVGAVRLAVIFCRHHSEGSITMSRSSIVGVTAIGLCFALGASPALAKKKEKSQPLESYSARVIAQGQVGVSGTAQVQIVINRWSTDEERQTVLNATADKDERSVAKALASLDPVGYFREISKRGYDLRYARKRTEGDTTVIILATDRPIAMFETTQNTRSFKHNVSIIELRVDAEGNGEGTLAAGVRIRFDKEKNQLVLENYSFAPLRLANVKLEKANK
jgi:hypothetical protein